MTVLSDETMPDFFSKIQLTWFSFLGSGQSRCIEALESDLALQLYLAIALATDLPKLIRRAFENAITKQNYLDESLPSDWGKFISLLREQDTAIACVIEKAVKKTETVSHTVFIYLDASPKDRILHHIPLMSKCWIEVHEWAPIFVLVP